MLKRRDEEGLTPRVMIINYCQTTEYLDENGIHISKDKMEYFEGKLMFSSLSALKFNRTSRKDDLISVCYLFLFLINGCKLPFF